VYFEGQAAANPLAHGALVAAHDDLEEIRGRGVGQPSHVEIVSAPSSSAYRFSLY
jgi:hypothetical protein